MTLVNEVTRLPTRLLGAGELFFNGHLRLQYVGLQENIPLL